MLFSPDSSFLLSGDVSGKILLWSLKLRGGDPIGLYTAAYEIGAIYWQSHDSVVLADLGGPYFRPHFYKIKLEGIE